MSKDFSFVNNLDYGQTGNQLTKAEIQAVQQDLTNHDLPQLPTDVIEFLQIYNGLGTEGRTIFGIDSQKHFFYDIIGENLNAELADSSDILLLGETDMTWVAWQLSKKSYVIIDKASQTVLHRLDNFANAVKYILQIDD